MDEQLKILMLLHFAVKHKDNTHSSEETYKLTGVTQNQISQYLSGKCEMPRATRIAVMQHIKHSLKLKRETYRILDSLSLSYLEHQAVKDLIEYIEKHGKLSAPRGRTEAVASKILELYKSLLNKSEKNSVVK